MSSAKSPPSLPAMLLVLGSVLIGMWFVPETLVSPPTFSFQNLGPADFQALVALLTPPTAGALFMLLFSLRMSNRTRALLALLISCIGSALMLLASPPPMLNGVFCIAIAASSIAGALALRNRVLSEIPTFAVASALPIFLVFRQLHAAFLGTYSLRYIAPMKYALSLSVFFIAVFSSIRVLRERQRAEIAKRH